jgi:hypothetical protein
VTRSFEALEVVVVEPVEERAVDVELVALVGLKQRVHVQDRDPVPLVQVRLAVFPVVGIADEELRLAAGVLLEDVRSRADRFGW